MGRRRRWILLAVIVAALACADSAWAATQPTITASPDSPGNTRSLSFSFSGDPLEPLDTFECKLDGPGGVVEDWTACTSPKPYTLDPTAPDGLYTFSVHAIDPLLAQSADSTATYTLDTTGPAVAFSQKPTSPGNSRSLTYGFTSESGATFECRLDGPAGAVQDWTACTSGDTFTIPANGPDGDYVFAVRATDTLDNTGAANTDTYTLDTTGPVVNISNPHSTPSNSRSLTYDFTSESGASFQCRLTRPDSSLFENWTSCSSGKTYDLTGEPDGSYTFDVKATDTLGNPGNAATDNYTLDTTGPIVTIDSGPQGQISDSSVSFGFTKPAGATTSCRLTRDGATVYDWTACTSPWGYGLSTQPDGNYEFAVIATDTLGNPGGPSTRDFTLSRPQPAAPAAESPPATPAGPDAPATLALRPGVCINLFNGTPGADKITGSGFGDVLIGFAGNDRLNGLDGNDCVLGDAGNDQLDGGTGDDDVRGQSGNDTVSGSSGNDTLSGDAGRDVLLGGSGDDQLTGGSAVDRFFGGSGNDTINAADGRAEPVDCGSGRDSVTADRVDRLSGCEKKKLVGRRHR